MKSKNISLIISGGTISSNYTNDGFIGNNKTDLTSLFDFEFYAVTSPFIKLSENFSFSDVATLAKAIDIQCRDEAVDGVILTLGTDTLSYTAPLLSALLENTVKPVMLVSSLSPLTDKESGGYKNMRAAIDYINKFAYKGIFVPFLNEKGGDLALHFAKRVLPIRPFEHTLSSMDNKIHGFFVSCSNYYDFLLREKPPENKKANTASLEDKIERLINTEKTSNVFLIRPYIGYNYKALNEFLQTKNNAVVIVDAFHSGTVKTDGENNINDIKKAQVYIAGGEKGKAKYESIKNLSDNIRTIDGITAAALYYEILVNE